MKIAPLSTVFTSQASQVQAERRASAHTMYLVPLALTTDHGLSRLSQQCVSSHGLCSPLPQQLFLWLLWANKANSSMTVLKAIHLDFGLHMSSSTQPLPQFPHNIRWLPLASAAYRRHSEVGCREDNHWKMQQLKKKSRLWQLPQDPLGGCDGARNGSAPS